MTSHFVPDGFRTYVDTGYEAHMCNLTRVAVMRQSADGPEVWSATASGWVPIPVDQKLPDEVWTLSALAPAVRALYEALRVHYGEADLESIKSLTAAREAVERRCDQLQAALIEIATRPAPAPAPLLRPGHTPGMRDLERGDLMPGRTGRYRGEPIAGAFEGLPDGQTPK